MNPTKEIDYLLDITGKLNDKYSFSQMPDTHKDTYFNDYNETNGYPEQVIPFDIQTPLDLTRLLDAMWDYQGCGYMKLYTKVLAVAAFKNRGSIIEEKEISPFIYEF